MNTAQSVPETCGVGVVCKTIGISRVTLYKLMHRNHIRPLPRDVDKDGIKLRFYCTDVARLLTMYPTISKPGRRRIQVAA